MSRPFRDKNKDLVNLEVVSSKQVWTKNKKGIPVLRQDVNIYGKIEKGTSAFIVNTNKKGKNSKFIEDTYRLPKKIKNDIVKHFSDNKYRVAYLIRKNK